MKKVFLLTALILVGCSAPKQESVSEEKVPSDFFDLTDIQVSGEIIVLTLYGRDTYYEYRGQGYGLQYQICQAFASDIGARVRVEIAADEKDLVEQLRRGEADLVAYNLPENPSLQDQLLWCGDSLETRHSSWVVRKNQPDLAEAVSSWFAAHEKDVHWLATARERQLAQLKLKPQMHRKAPMKDAAKGLISDYDHFFKLHCKSLGWDWKLLAAQCYQESGFDPQATSWAGARGLMQFMPSTAREVGLSMDKIFDPEESIKAGVKYLKKLNQTFTDVHSPTERMNFMLAAYNCGPLHVRDAQALAKKYGKNPLVWKGNVEEYILLLQESKYYRDPVVQNGYCRGSETYNYVRDIMERYNQYRKKVR